MELSLKKVQDAFDLCVITRRIKTNGVILSILKLFQDHESARLVYMINVGQSLKKLAIVAFLDFYVIICIWDLIMFSKLEFVLSYQFPLFIPNH